MNPSSNNPFREPGLTDEEFKKKYANLFYKTHNKGYGKDKILIEPDKEHGLNGFFTTHLSQAGMYRNNGLKTAVDRERYVDGARDWMDNLS